MREIMFRGKRLDNGEWAEGYLYEHEPALVGIVSENDVPEPSKWFIARTGFADWNIPRPVEFVEVAPSTVGQYTGLTDKNGKRIFEGDILLHDRAIRHSEKKTSREKQIRVVWFNRCGWEGKLIGGKSCSWSLNTLWDGDTFEVIGNIYDNPEMLKGGEG